MEAIVAEAPPVVYEATITKIEAAGASLRGVKRTVNEDAVFQYTGQTAAGQWRGLHMVCDGLGGHEAGEVASSIAVETIAGRLSDLYEREAPQAAADATRPTPGGIEGRIHAAIDEANTRIRRLAQAQAPEARKLGTTVTLALWDGDVVYIANVGDSRTYAARGGTVTQITEDHSLAAKMIEEGIVDASNGAAPPQNVIYRALGIDDEIQVDFFRWQAQPGDKLLLCSDGFWQAFPDQEELARWLTPVTAPADLCKQLVSEARRRDGSDDTSALIVAAF